MKNMIILQHSTLPQLNLNLLVLDLLLLTSYYRPPTNVTTLPPFPVTVTMIIYCLSNTEFAHSPYQARNTLSNIKMKNVHFDDYDIKCILIIMVSSAGLTMEELLVVIILYSGS